MASTSNWYFDETSMAGQVAKSSGEGWTAQDVETHVREEHSTFSWIIEAMLKQAGFVIAEANYPALTYAEYTCMKAEVMPKGCDGLTNTKQG